MKKKVGFLLLALVVLVVIFAVYVQFTYKQSFDEQFPVQEMSIVGDSAMIARGRYLAYGPAHCASCHLPIDQLERMEAGEELPMIGGFEFVLPIATLYTPNLTPDKETGIGRLSDGELYRMMRYNINHSGEATPELMPFRNMSKYDVKSVIAFLRSQPAVHNQVPVREETFVWKLLQRFVFKPLVPDEPVPVKMESDTSLVYGKYLAESVANCRGCHTARDLATGEYTGPYYAGGLVFEPAPDTKGWKFVTPNLTADPETGIMADWSEEAFIKRFRAGLTNPGSPMPWGTFAKLKETDLKAIYRFLNSIEPIENPGSGVSTPPTVAANSK